MPSRRLPGLAPLAILAAVLVPRESRAQRADYAPPPRSTSAPDTLACIKAEAESARGLLLEQVHEIVTSERASSAAEVEAANEAVHARLLGLMDRALTLARLHPGEDEGLAAPAWVAQQASFEGGDDVGERGDAAYRLLADAPVLDDPVIYPAMTNVAEVVGPRCPEVEPFLRSVLSRSRKPYLVAMARFELGRYLVEMARMHDRLAAPISGPELTKELTEACLDRCRAFDGPRLRSEAETLLEEVVRLDDDRLRIGVGSRILTPGEAAAGELFRLRHLRIGQTAPELVGEDVDGAPLRLGDFRGKVVLLSFWATSSDPSMDLIREQLILAATMKGRPFAPVGVNVDAAEDRPKVKEAIAKEGITWRSFWAGGFDGAIPRKWGVEGWPSAYLIDANGIIRDDQAGDDLTPAAFEPLVLATEKAAR